jgi:hypothetical protein
LENTYLPVNEKLGFGMFEFARKLSKKIPCPKSLGTIYMLHRCSPINNDNLYWNEHMKVSPEYLRNFLTEKRKTHVFLSLDMLYELSLKKIKLIHSYDTPAEVRQEGLEQITRYRDKIDSGTPSYLVIFDRRDETKRASWEERLSWQNENGITVIGC